MLAIARAALALAIPAAVFANPSDHWQVLRDGYGDPQAAVDLDSINTKVPGLTIALVKDKAGREGFFVTDCGQFLWLVDPRNRDDLTYQLDHVTYFFARFRQHIHPASLGEALVKTACAARPKAQP